MNNYYITPEDYETAAKNGIKASTLYNRVNRLGWNTEKATTTPVQKKDKWFILAEKNGINYDAYYSRVKKLGWDRERAATTPLQTPESRRGKYENTL